MGKNKRRAEKAKSRERIAKGRVAARRKAHREEARKKRIVQRQEKLLGEKIQPFVKEENREQYFARRDAAIQNKMERNLAALEAIVAEMDKEESERKSLNEKLEEMGHTTIEEKVRALAEMSQSLEESKNSKSETGESESSE